MFEIYRFPAGRARYHTGDEIADVEPGDSVAAPLGIFGTREKLPYFAREK